MSYAASVLRDSVFTVEDPGYSCSARGGVDVLSAYVSCRGCVRVLRCCAFILVVDDVALYIKQGESFFG